MTVRVNGSQAHWNKQLLDHVSINELYHCETTVDVWEPLNLCTANPTDRFHLECEHRVCTLASIVISETYSDDCYFCIDNACCDEDLGLPGGGTDPYPDESSYMISMPPAAPAGFDLDAGQARVRQRGRYRHRTVTDEVAGALAGLDQALAAQHP